MDDTEFFDQLYQQWAQTTWAEHSYWMPEEDESFPGKFSVIAIRQASEATGRNPIASFLAEKDADFICGLHGAIPDLIRRLHEAVEEADRADERRDTAEGNLAEAYLEIAELKDYIESLERTAGIGGKP